ncbi:hypothetical protein B484DRAFT_425120, partial [Ochromonadaceae sp. CCMP2298]
MVHAAVTGIRHCHLFERKGARTGGAGVGVGVGVGAGSRAGGGGLGAKPGGRGKGAGDGGGAGAGADASRKVGTELEVGGAGERPSGHTPFSTRLEAEQEEEGGVLRRVSAFFSPPKAPRGRAPFTSPLTLPFASPFRRAPTTPTHTSASTPAPTQTHTPIPTAPSTPTSAIRSRLGFRVPSDTTPLRVGAGAGRGAETGAGGGSMGIGQSIAEEVGEAEGNEGNGENGENEGGKGDENNKGDEEEGESSKDESKGAEWVEGTGSAPDKLYAERWLQLHLWAVERNLQQVRGDAAFVLGMEELGSGDSGGRGSGGSGGGRGRDGRSQQPEEGPAFEPEDDEVRGQGQGRAWEGPGLCRSAVLAQLQAAALTTLTTPRIVLKAALAACNTHLLLLWSLSLTALRRVLPQLLEQLRAPHRSQCARFWRGQVLVHTQSWSAGSEMQYRPDREALLLRIVAEQVREEAGVVAG